MDESNNLALLGGGGGGLALLVAVFQGMRIWKRDRQTEDVHERSNKATDSLMTRVTELEKENKELRAENKQLAMEVGQLHGQVEALQTLLNTQVKNLEAGYRRLKRENFDLRKKLGLEADAEDEPGEVLWTENHAS